MWRYMKPGNFTQLKMIDEEGDLSVDLEKLSMSEVLLKPPFASDDFDSPLLQDDTISSAKIENKESIDDLSDAFEIKADTQRTIGFEFEMDECRVCEYKEGKSVDWKHELHSKVVILKKEWVRAESDSGHVEIVTDKISSIEQLEKMEKNFRAIVEEIKETKSDLKPNRYGRISRNNSKSLDYNVFEIIEQENRNFADFSGDSVAITKGVTRGKLQGTLGLPLANLIDLFDREKTWPALIKYLLSDSEKEQVLSLPHLRNASNELKGFILLIEHYISWLSEAKPEEQGPKTALALMCRINFHAIYVVLARKDQELFNLYVAEKNKTKVVLFKRGYYVGKKEFVHQAWSLYINEWVLSIQDPEKGVNSYITRFKDKLEKEESITLKTGHKNHDLLSPPPFFLPHNSGEVFTYAMGLYPMQSDKHILLEFRDLAEQKQTLEGTRISYENATKFMDEFASFAFQGVIPAQQVKRRSALLSGTDSQQHPARTHEDTKTKTEVKEQISAKEKAHDVEIGERQEEYDKDFLKLAVQAMIEEGTNPALVTNPSHARQKVDPIIPTNLSFISHRLA